MTDFDDVLERLLTDPVFQARLAANPEAALAGYRLDPSERDLLRAQLTGVDAADRTVETRTSKSGIVGLLGPVISALELAGSPGAVETIGNAPVQSLGHAPVESFGHAPAT